MYINANIYHLIDIFMYLLFENSLVSLYISFIILVLTILIYIVC